MVFSYLAARRDCKAKQASREEAINSLPAVYHEPLTVDDEAILNTPASELIANVHSGKWTPLSILHSYGKKAIIAQRRLNCLTEILIPSAESWAQSLKVSLVADGSITNSDETEGANRDRPLAGMPISLKDTTDVEGYDSTLGYSAWANKPALSSSPLVHLLLDAGALPFVKTTTPITLLSSESTSALFGRTLNPHHLAYSPGGSSGGEGALLAFGGSRIGIGTDVAGSVRVPAHYCGVYSIKSSAARFPSSGLTSSINGLEGVPATCAPMARTLGDLETAWKGVMAMRPWEYDHSVVPIPWRNVDIPHPTFAVMWSDDIIPPTPACKRALQLVVSSLKLEGYDVVEFPHPTPSAYEAFKIASQLILADGGHGLWLDVRPGEMTHGSMEQYMFWSHLPLPLKYLYIYYIRYIRRDALYADLLRAHVRPLTAAENWKAVAGREGVRRGWGERVRELGVDFLLTVPNAAPAVPEFGMKYTWKACDYSVLFNLLDWTAGVLPVTKVSKHLDALSPSALSSVRKMNTLARQVYELYDAEKMEGLPVGVQVVGGRYEEEKVLEGMRIVERALEAQKVGYRA